MRSVLRVSVLGALVAMIALGAILLMRACAPIQGDSSVIRPVSARAGGAVRDSNRGPSFVPQIEFWGTVLEDGYQSGVGFSTCDLRYEAGEPIELVLALRNASDRRLDLTISPEFDHYLFSVLDSSGNPVPLTKAGQQVMRNRLRGSCTVRCVSPGGEYTETVRLSDYYDMSAPGGYTIKVSRNAEWPLGGTHAEVAARDQTLSHQVGPIHIDVGDVPSESLEDVGTLQSSGLQVDRKDDTKTLTISRQAAGTETQGSASPTGGARVTVVCPQIPTGGATHLPRRVVSAITTFFEHTADKGDRWPRFLP
jgi:hypothetical protein